MAKGYSIVERVVRREKIKKLPQWIIFLLILALFMLGEIVFSAFGLIRYTTAEFQHGLETLAFFLFIFLSVELLRRTGRKSGVKL